MPGEYGDVNITIRGSDNYISFDRQGLVIKAGTIVEQALMFREGDIVGEAPHTVTITGASLGLKTSASSGNNRIMTDTGQEVTIDYSTCLLQSAGSTTIKYNVTASNVRNDIALPKPIKSITTKAASAQYSKFKVGFKKDADDTWPTGTTVGSTEFTITPPEDGDYYHFRITGASAALLQEITVVY